MNLADDIEIDPKKYYIAFKKGRNLFDVEIKRNSFNINVNLRLGSLDDSKGLARDVSKIGHRGNGDYQLWINTDEDMEYIMSLLKQTL